MKILLLGKSGQLGWELQRSLAPLGELVCFDRKGAGGLSGDLADAEGLAEAIRVLAPEVIVNAAAYTAVDKAEEERELASCINEVAPGVIAAEARKLGALVVHYSTDYVFDGSGTEPWRESDATAPLNHYGASKLAGERAIQESGCNYLIFRTSWVYAARGQNFLATIERLIRERDSLKIVNDQIGAPTSAELIADVSAHAMQAVLGKTAQGGLFHLSASGYASWHDYALLVADWLLENGIPTKLGPGQIQSQASADYSTPAKRPLNSRLDTELLQQTFGLSLPHWQTGVERALVERNL